MLQTASLHKNKINIFSVLRIFFLFLRRENESIKRLLCFLFAETALFINIKAKTEVYAR